MKREFFGFHLMRLLLLAGIFILLLLIYWSSNLVEQDLKQIHLKLDRLEKERRMEARPLATDKHAADAIVLLPRKHIDPNLPNLLIDDPFYSETLPKLLGTNFQPEGIFESDQLGRPNNLHPFSGWAHIAEFNNLCTVSLARLQFGKYETFAPYMAIKIEERRNKETKELEFWIHLRDGVYWNPLEPRFFVDQMELAPQFFEKHQVTAEDFKFFFDAMMNPNVQEAGAVALRTYYNDIEKIEVIDPLTFVVKWKNIPVTESNGEVVLKPKYVAKLLTGGLRPLPRWIYQYFADGSKIIEEQPNQPEDLYRMHSVWAQNFNQHWAKNVIVSCGPWMFDGMTDRQIRFRRNPNHFFQYDALASAMEVHFKDALEATWEDFKAGKIDTYELRPDQILELERFLQSDQYQRQAQAGNAIKRLDYIGRVYTYIGWNEAKPFFKSPKVRRAMTMAIDRNRVIQQNLNGMGIEIACPFFPFSTAYDPSIIPWPFDLQQARLLLEEEGWFDSDNDGIIDKEIDGKRVPFSFSLTYYVKNNTGKAIAEYIATVLKEIGIHCRLNGVDITDLTSIFEDKSFDALSLAWGLGTPPEDLKQLWHSSGAKEKGSSNAIGFANAEVDQIIDQLQYEADAGKRKALYYQFDAIFHQETPYTLMYTPKVTLLYREYVQNVFLPIERQDLVPGANIAQPDSSIFWLKSK